jgi:hypothetical protein
MFIYLYIIMAIYLYVDLFILYFFIIGTHTVVALLQYNTLTPIVYITNQQQLLIFSNL